MEQPENPEKIKENNREEAVAWLKKWLDKQLKRKSKGENYDAHADCHLNPADLTDKDIEIWIKIKDKTITVADINIWRKELNLAKPTDKDSEEYKKWDSRHTFCLLAANLATGVIGFRELGIKTDSLSL